MITLEVAVFAYVMSVVCWFELHFVFMPIKRYDPEKYRHYLRRMWLTPVWPLALTVLLTQKLPKVLVKYWNEAWGSEVQK